MFENVKKCDKATYKCKECYFCANVFYQNQFSFTDVMGGEGRGGEQRRGQEGAGQEALFLTLSMKSVINAINDGQR